MPETNESDLKQSLMESDPEYQKLFKETADEIKQSVGGESAESLEEKMEKALPKSDRELHHERNVRPVLEAQAAYDRKTEEILGNVYAGNLVIPDEALPFIRYQRSRYKESKRPDPEEVKRLYAQHVLEDYEGMKAHLPPVDQVKVILEIGCGIGALNVHLQRHYPDARVELLDGDSVSNEGGAGYSDKPDVYNSRAITELMLRANGCKVDRWHDLNTKETMVADLIVSLASWTYHFPESTYSVRGLCITDRRRGAEKLRGQVIYQGPKYDRCLYRL